MITEEKSTTNENSDTEATETTPTQPELSVLEQITPSPIKKNKNKNNSVEKESQRNENEDETETELQFFKSLIPTVRQLNIEKKISFKIMCLTNLKTLLQEQQQQISSLQELTPPTYIPKKSISPSGLFKYKIIKTSETAI